MSRSLGAAVLVFASAGAAWWFVAREAEVDPDLSNPEPSVLRTIEIRTAAATRTRLERALEVGDPSLRHERGGDRPFYDAVVVENGGTREGEVSLLAPRPFHDPERPALRLKFDKDLVRDGVRRIDLYPPRAPLAIDDVWFARCAAQVDLLHDRSQHARVVWNGADLGIYALALPTGLAMTQACARPAGTFVFSEPGVFTDARAWARFGRDDTEQAPIREFVSAVSDPAADADLEELLDIDAVARWAAVRLVTGRVADPQAQSALLFSETSGRFEPLAWRYDGRFGLGVDEHPLVQRLATHDWFVERRDLAVDELLETVCERSAIDGWVERWKPRVGGADEVWEAFVERVTARVDRLRARERVPAESAPDEVVLGPGEVVIRSDVRTGLGQTLRIRGGTTLVFERNSGIVARGPLVVEGVASAPVEMRSGERGGFAGLVLLGRGTAGSRVTRLVIDGASPGATRYGEVRSGVLVYDAPDVMFSACRFGPCSNDRDSVHVVRSSVRFQACEFMNAKRNALDVSFSNVRVEATKFEAADRDAIRLEASEGHLLAVTVSRAGRAALSASARSRVGARQSEFEQSEFGVEARDDARVWLQASRIEANRIGVECEHVEWRFARGGEVALDQCVFVRNLEAGIRTKKRSAAWLHRTAMPQVVSGKKRVDVVALPFDGWLDG